MPRHSTTRAERGSRSFRILLAGLALAAAGTVHADYVFTTIDYPGAEFTDVRGINNAGEIVGYARNVSGNFGFKYSGGHFSRLPPAPGGRTINGHGINDSGLIVGSADSADGTTTEGFILDGSTYAFFSYPGLDRTYARAISADGMVTGYAEDDGITLNRGFIYDPVTGSFTDLAVPGAVHVIAQGINDAHQVVGSSIGTTVESFLRDPVTGALTMFQIEGRPTRARGINNTGLITGFHNDATGRVAAFVAQSGGYQLLYINASDDTIGEAINDAGQVSGLFSTPGAATTHGFIATPAALPVGTTASGAYVFSVDVVADTPIFIDPEVALGYEYRIGHGDPNFVTVRLPIGIGDNQYVLTVNGRSYPLAAGELFDFRAHGHADGVRRFRVGGIEVDAMLDPRNPYAFPTQVSFAADGRFTGTMGPLCRRQPLPPQASRAMHRALQKCRP